MSAMAVAATEIECSRGDRITKSLLGYGLVAGPVYLVASLAQGLLRPGFDLAHDDVSLLSNGALGWIQIANFIVTGAFVIAAAVGMGRALTGRSVWGPRLMAVFGAGLVAAGVFVADPMNGFPAGTPAGRPETITVHGMLHIIVAAIGFICLIASCFVNARRYGRESRSRMKWFSIVTGVVFLLAFAGVASGSSSAIVILGFWAGVILAFAWIAAVSLDLYRQTPVSPKAV